MEDETGQGEAPVRERARTYGRREVLETMWQEGATLCLDHVCGLWSVRARGSFGWAGRVRRPTVEALRGEGLIKRAASQANPYSLEVYVLSTAGLAEVRA